MHDGDLTITTPGTVIQDMRVTGMIRIMASNVTIRRSEVYGYIQLMARDPYGGLRIEDSTVGPPSGVSDWIHGAIGVKAYTALRVEIRNMPDGFRVAGNDVLIQDSFFKAKPDGGCPHHDGVQGYYGGTNVIVRHNTLDVRAPARPRRSSSVTGPRRSRPSTTSSWVERSR